MPRIIEKELRLTKLLQKQNGAISGGGVIRGRARTHTHTHVHYWRYSRFRHLGGNSYENEAATYHCPLCQKDKVDLGYLMATIVVVVVIVVL